MPRPSHVGRAHGLGGGLLFSLHVRPRQAL